MGTASSAPCSTTSTGPNGGTIVKKVCRSSAPPLQKLGTVSESKPLVSEVSVHPGLDRNLCYHDLLSYWVSAKLTICECTLVPPPTWGSLHLLMSQWGRFNTTHCILPWPWAEIVCRVSWCSSLSECVGLSVCLCSRSFQETWDVGANAYRSSVPWLTLLSSRHPKVVLQAALLLQDCPCYRIWCIMGLFGNG